MIKYHFITFLLLSILNLQCKKNNDSIIDISAITTTDEIGNVISIDNTDWKNDNNWSAGEYALFQTPTGIQLADTETGTVTIYPASQNPVRGAIVDVTVKTSKETFLQVIFTDNMLSIKQRNFIKLPPGTTTNAIMLDPSIFSNNTNYRMYYGFYSSTDALFYKGHGDIRISR